MYRFCRVDLFGKISSWTLEIDNFEKYKEWNGKFQFKYISEGAEDIKKNWIPEEERQTRRYPDQVLRSHWISEVGRLSEIVGGDETEYDLAGGFNKVIDDLIDSKYYALKKEGAIYVYEGCQWFTRPKECDIVEIIEKAEMKYPKYSKDDIKIIKWEGGRHYYAKIGSNEVKDTDGKNRWNTYDYAYKMALEALARY